MTRQLFDDLIGDPPPTTIDVGGLVRRERRRGAIRRGGLTVAACAAVGASVALAAGPWGATGPAHPVAGPTPPRSAAQPAQFRLAADTRASAEASAQALRAALDRAVHQSAPKARWLAQDMFGNPAPDGQPPRLIGDDRAPKADQMFYGGTGLTSDGRRGSLTLQVVSTRPCVDPANPKCALERDNPDREQRLRAELLLSCPPRAQACSVRTDPNGARLLVQTVTTRRPGVPAAQASVSYEVRVQLPDARVLSVAESNELAAGDGRSSVQQPEPPLTREQLVSIATAVSGQIVA